MIGFIKEMTCKREQSQASLGVCREQPSFVKQIIFTWRFKRAVRKANKLSRMFGMKYLVISLNGGLKVVPKQTIRELVARHRFRKGVTVADIEKRALYIADGRRTPCS